MAITTIAYSRVSHCYQFPEGPRRANRGRSNGTFQAENSPEAGNADQKIRRQYRIRGNLWQSVRHREWSSCGHLLDLESGGLPLQTADHGRSWPWGGHDVWARLIRPWAEGV